MSIAITTGEGVYQTAVGGVEYDYYVTGHSFNPHLPTGWPNTIIAAGILGAGSTFDLTGYYPGTEVILAYVYVVGPESGNAYMYWYHPAGDIYFTYSIGSWTVPAGYWGECWSYCGVKPASLGNNSEINVNGTYTVEIVIGSNWNSTTFAISNLDTGLLTLHTGHEGYVWVEGDNICFISYMGTKHTIGNDGSTYGTSADYGYIWVPNTSSKNYLCYVDSSGYIRHTKDADAIGWGGYDGVGTSGHTAGYIWTEWGFNWTYLMFINYDGWQLRISQGYMWGNQQ